MVGDMDGKYARERQTLINVCNQAIGIIEKLYAGLDFTLAEIKETGRKHPGTFTEDLRKAEKFHDAEVTRDLAKKYLDAIND